MDGSRFDLLNKLEPKVYDYFINRTKLGYILMISDVDIKSDNDYMDKKHKMDKKNKKWHEDHSHAYTLDFEKYPRIWWSWIHIKEGVFQISQ